MPIERIQTNGTPAPVPEVKPTGQMGWYVSLVILCLPIALSVLRYHSFALPRSLFQWVLFLVIQLFVWGAVFAVAFRITGVSARQLYVVTNRPPMRAVWFGILWFFLLWAVIYLITYFQFLWMNSKWLWATEERLFAVINGRDIPQHSRFCAVVYASAAVIFGCAYELWRSAMLRGLRTVFPDANEKGIVSLIAVVFVALLFGASHLYLGLYGVEIAIVVGFVLGVVLFYQRSYWQLAVAHTLLAALIYGVFLYLAFNPTILSDAMVNAALKDDLPTVRHLLNIGGNPNVASNFNGTLLAAAARQRDTDIVKLILMRGANPNIKDDRGESPLIAASEGDEPQNVELLIYMKVDLDWKDKRGFTALRAAAQYDRVQAATLLLNAGADPNITDNADMTPLAAAKRLHFYSLAALLEKNGAK